MFGLILKIFPDFSLMGDYEISKFLPLHEICVMPG